jgi:hypothetical protein
MRPHRLLADVQPGGDLLRAVVGTAVLLTLIAVFALGVGALLRHTAAAVTVVFIVLPLNLTTWLPLGTAQWLQRLTPVAGFTVQETLLRYDFMDQLCLPENGCYPQGPLDRPCHPRPVRRSGARPRGMAAEQERRVRAAVHAEWTKLRKLPSTWWLLLSVVALYEGKP